MSEKNTDKPQKPKLASYKAIKTHQPLLNPTAMNSFATAKTTALGATPVESITDDPQGRGVVVVFGSKSNALHKKIIVPAIGISLMVEADE